MTHTLSPHLWPPQARGVQATIDALSRVNRVCLHSPTGGGKTAQAIELFRWADSQGIDGCFYVNRKLLVSQTAARFGAEGLLYGVRAADYEEMFDPAMPYQICSIDTEKARCIDRQTWKFHDAGLVVVDEAHIQKSKAMAQVLERYEKLGAKIVLLTATPVGLSDWADELVVSGKMQEYRDCNSLVLASVKSIGQPDLRRIKRNATGEYELDGEKRRIFTQSIVGKVIDGWKTFNPDARPTMMYAPGKPESVWLTEQFQKLGVSWCHVDATDAVIDGKRAPLTRSLWKEILERYKDGSIKGLSSRFKLREGIDCPFTYHVILATPIGSLASYVQTVGRVLRFSNETPDHVLITDHGGNYWRHGSPNADRPWDRWWTLPEHAISELNQKAMQEGLKKESIVCPRCKTERTGGRKCPDPPYGCGFEHDKSKREVIQENGTLEEVEGDLLRPLRIQRRSDTERLWSQMYWGYRNKGLKKSFAQLEGFFAHEYGYHPPRDLPFMPRNAEDWYRHVPSVALGDLTRKGEAAA
jgi:superfamily II DNA or RNA helicase